jgi:hypothetical protein
MEQWITRSVATLVALGALGLFWTFGMFSAVPVQQGRMFALSGVEMQLMGVSLLAGLATAWGALHLFSLADRESSPRCISSASSTWLDQDQALPGRPAAGGSQGQVRSMATNSPLDLVNRAGARRAPAGPRAAGR